MNILVLKKKKEIPQAKIKYLILVEAVQVACVHFHFLFFTHIFKSLNSNFWTFATSLK